MPIIPTVVKVIPPPVRKHLPWLLVVAMTCIAIVGFGSSGFSTILQAAPPALTVTGVTPNNSSVRVFYNPISGAKDYRVYDVANPNDVKYAGLAHYTDNFHRVITPPGWVANTGQDVPAFDIEWNGLNDTAPHSLVVEAVDALGPVPQTSLYQGPPNGAKTGLSPGGMLGSNKGATSDGKTSTNGQGPYTNKPNVIARSQPFVVQAQPQMSPLGKIAGATQTYLDTFDQSEAATLNHTVHSPCGVSSGGDLGVDSYTLNAGTPKESAIELRLHDSILSMPFISNSHFMDMLFSGQTGESPCNGNADITYGSLAFTPKQTVNMGPGMILHQTMEVDNHNTFARWMAFNVSPAGDPILSWEPDLHKVNNQGQALFVDLLSERLDIRVFNGSTTPVFATSPAVFGELYIPMDYMQSGRGLDDRSRLDLFVSQTHLALFEDNTLLTQVNIPATAMPWFNGAVKAYFAHYMYHSDNDMAFLRTGTLSGLTFCYPMNAYWFNDPVNGLAASQDACGIAYPPGYGFPHSDERHWDNLGFEALPASAAPAGDFSSLGASVKIDNPSPPVFAGGPPPPTNTPEPPTNTPVPATATAVSATATALATQTVQPTSVPATCAASYIFNGTPTTFSRPVSECANQ